MSAAAEHHGPLRKTAESLIVSTCFAVGLGSALVLLHSVAGIGNVIETVNRAGVDAGMFINTEFSRERRPDRLGKGREPAYVFLDIGQTACERFYAHAHPAEPTADQSTPSAQERCTRFQPAQPELVGAVLEAVLSRAEKPPRVVVVDALLIDREAAPEWPPQNKTIGYASDVPVVAVVPSRWSGHGTALWINRAADPVQSGLLDRRTALAATALAFADPASEGDAVIRRYWPARLTIGEPAAPEALVPTVGFAAAMLADKRRLGDASAVFGSGRSLCEGNACEEDPCENAAVRRIAEDFELDPLLLCTRGYRPTLGDEPPAQGSALIYSIRSLAIAAVAPSAQEVPPDRHQRLSDKASSAQGRAAASASRFDQAIYWRFPIDVGPDGRIAEIAPQWLNDSVVVIGSSSPSGNDRHVTPIGAMAGAEVIINAARAFRTFPAPEAPTLSERLAHKIEISVIAAVIFTILAWLPIWLLQSWKPRTRFASHIVIPAASTCIFFAAVALTMIAVVVVEMMGLRQLMAARQLPSDVLTPVFAVALEGFAEGANWLLLRLERFAEALLSATEALLGVVGRPLARWWKHLRGEGGSSSLRPGGEE